VPGLGDVRRKALLNRFGSLKKLRAATVQDIQDVPGFGQRTAMAVYEALDASRQPASEPIVNTATGEIVED